MRVLEHVKASMAVLVATLGRMPPGGGELVGEDRARAEAIAASMAVCIRLLAKRPDVRHGDALAERGLETVKRDAYTVAPPLQSNGRE